MEIPSSISDLFFIIVIVIPGYASFFIFRWLAYLEEKWSDQDILFLSFACSVIIYISTGYLSNVSEFDKIKDIILEPSKLLILLFVTFLLGIVPGGILRIWYWRNDISPGNTWVTAIESAMEGDEDVWILVYTNDGKEYKGIINYYDAGEEPNSISIRRPIQIIRNEDYFVNNEFEIGKEIIFKEDDIARIVFFKEV
jgi:hypothetical protein